MYIAEELWILVEVLASSSLPGCAVTLRCSSSKKNGYIDTGTRRFPGCGRVEPVMMGYFEHTYTLILSSMLLSWEGLWSAL